MDFEYKLSGIGWANVRITVDNQNAYFCVSYITDALGDLTHSLVLLAPGLLPQDETEEFVTFEWEQEPVIACWNVKRVSNSLLSLRIEEFDSTEKIGRGTIAMNCTVDLVEFITKVVSALDQLLKNHGLVGYRDTWYDFDFPLSDYLKLKNYVKTKRAFTVREEEVEGTTIRKSNLREELDLFGDLLENS